MFSYSSWWNLDLYVCMFLYCSSQCMLKRATFYLCIISNKLKLWYFLRKCIWYNDKNRHAVICNFLPGTAYTLHAAPRSSIHIFQTGSYKPAARRNKKCFSNCHLEIIFVLYNCFPKGYTLYYNKSEMYSVILGRNWKGYLIAFLTSMWNSPKALRMILDIV